LGLLYVAPAGGGVGRSKGGDGATAGWAGRLVVAEFGASLPLLRGSAVWAVAGTSNQAVAGLVAEVGAAVRVA